MDTMKITKGQASGLAAIGLAGVLALGSYHQYHWALLVGLIALLAVAALRPRF